MDSPYVSVMESLSVVDDCESCVLECELGVIDELVVLLGAATHIYVSVLNPLQFAPREGFQALRLATEISLSSAIVVQLSFL